MVQVDPGLQVILQSAGRGRTERPKEYSRVLRANATSEGTGALDLMFVIDVTGSMSDDIEAVKTQVLTIIADVQTKGGAGSRVGLFTHGDECSDGTAWRTFTDLTTGSEWGRS
jgi:Mg-chelatase subunit ChlD